MAFDCVCGSSFVLNGHLWVVVCEPFDSPTKVIIVFLTSRKSYSDQTIVLRPQDHDFIRHETVVSYADARIVQTDYIIRRVSERDVKPHDSLRDEVIKVIQQGLINSPRTPRDVKKIFINLLGT